MEKGCYNCMRVLLVIMNIIFLLIGLAMLGLSVFLYLDTTVADLKASYGLSWQVNVVLFAAMAVGGVTIVISAFGCCGAYHESPCQLGAYLTCLILIAAVEVAGAVFLYMNWSNATVRDSLTQAISSSIRNSTGADSVPGHIVQLQSSLRCCGANGSSDYDAATAAAVCRTRNGTVFTEGCVNKSMQVMQGYSLWIFIGVVSIAVLELFVMLLSVWLCCVAQRQTEYSTVNTAA